MFRREKVNENADFWANNRNRNVYPNNFHKQYEQVDTVTAKPLNRNSYHSFGGGSCSAVSLEAAVAAKSVCAAAAAAAKSVADTTGFTPYFPPRCPPNRVLRPSHLRVIRNAEPIEFDNTSSLDNHSPEDSQVEIIETVENKINSSTPIRNALSKPNNPLPVTESDVFGKVSQEAIDNIINLIESINFDSSDSSIRRQKRRERKRYRRLDKYGGYLSPSSLSDAETLSSVDFDRKEINSPTHDWDIEIQETTSTVSTTEETYSKVSSYTKQKVSSKSYSTNDSLKCYEDGTTTREVSLLSSYGCGGANALKDSGGAEYEYKMPVGHEFITVGSSSEKLMLIGKRAIEDYLRRPEILANLEDGTTMRDRCRFNPVYTSSMAAKKSPHPKLGRQNFDTMRCDNGIGFTAETHSAIKPNNRYKNIDLCTEIELPRKRKTFFLKGEVDSINKPPPLESEGELPLWMQRVKFLFLNRQD